MSEPVVKQRPTRDLDEFERRMGRDPLLTNEGDPLAELARLVGEPYDPFSDVFAQEAAALQSQRGPYVAHGGAEPVFSREVAPRLFGDFAAIEAGLRGTVAPDAGPSYGAPTAHDFQHGQYVDPGETYSQAGYEQDWTAQQAQHHASYQQKASRRPIYIMATTIAVGVIGIGAAFALKGHVSSSPREIKTIMADAGPTKVQPPPEAASDTAATPDSALLGKAARLPVTSLVNSEEQPVDLAQAVQENAAKASTMAPGGFPGSVTDASAVPVPPSPRQIQTAMADPKASANGGEQAQTFGLANLPAPKRVKVVSVRPDGTILPNDTPPAAAIPATRAAPAKTNDHPVPVAKSSTPKAATPKTTSRAMTTPKTIESVAGDDAAQPAPVEAKPAKKTKPQPQRVASVDTGADEPTEAATPAAPAGSGTFAVQLAAPGSESEAKAASSRLAKKYADALGSFRLGFFKAESNGKSVYRVRVSSLSKADAISLCDKLKADGGTCFVAKN